MLKRSVVIGLSPNFDISDYLLALKALLTPWQWKEGIAIKQVEDWFKKYFKVKEAISFNSGRSALLAILASLNLPAGSEVFVQAFTCVAVPNSVVWAGYKPVYVDVDETLNINVVDAQKKLTPFSKVLIVQHTFGVPANMDKITRFCKKNQLILIEDCAHALGATYKGKLVGTFGKAAFFSFGRDKIVSSVFGGVAISNDKDLNKKITQYRNQLSFPSLLWLLQQLLHPVITLPALMTYNLFSIGKIILYLAQKTKMLSLPVYTAEKSGYQPTLFPKKYPNVLARLLINQLNNIENMNQRRREIAKQYYLLLKSKGFKLLHFNREAVYLRYNILTKRRDEIRFRAKRAGIILGDWYAHVVDPADVLLDKVGYTQGSCSRAEQMAAMSLNLPTYPLLSNSQVAEVTKIVNS